MFALIDLKDANYMAIHIPAEGADKAIPALAKMLETNAVFVRKNWNDINVTKVNMSIVIGNQLEFDNHDFQMLIKEVDFTFPEGFNFLAPEVLISCKKALEEKEAKIKKLNTEIEYLKSNSESVLEKYEELGQKYLVLSEKYQQLAETQI